MIKIADIILIVAAYYGVERDDILSGGRHKTISRCRQVAMYLSSTLTLHSSKEIGRAFDRDHTTVLHAVRRIEALMQTDGALKTAVDYLANSVLLGQLRTA